MLPKWLEPNNPDKISEFIKRIIKFKDFISEEDMNKCDEGLDTLKYCRTTYSKEARRFGKIVEKVQGGYKFTEDFKDAFKKIKI